MSDQDANKSQRNSIAAGVVTTVVVTTIILGTASDKYSILQSAVFGVVFGLVAGLTVLAISRFQSKPKQNS